jgi:hypothetical protein
MTTNAGHTPEEIIATVKGLRARARKVPADRRGAHFQIAKRRISDATMFAESNTEHAEKCCWEARFHLNHCEG